MHRDPDAAIGAHLFHLRRDGGQICDRGRHGGLGQGLGAATIARFELPQGNPLRCVRKVSPQASEAIKGLLKPLGTTARVDRERAGESAGRGFLCEAEMQSNRPRFWLVSWIQSHPVCGVGHQCGGPQYAMKPLPGISDDPKKRGTQYRKPPRWISTAGTANGDRRAPWPSRARVGWAPRHLPPSCLNSGLFKEEAQTTLRPS